MCDGSKKALGHTQSKTAPLRGSCGEMITDRNKQIERWVENFSQLYCSKNNVISSAVSAIASLLSMDELDAQPKLDEFDKAIASMAPGKSPGNNRIAPDLIICCRSTLLHPHEILCQCSLGCMGHQKGHPIQEQRRQE